MKRRLVPLVLLALVGLGAGCGDALRNTIQPTCTGDPGIASLGLSAQAVPTAELVPCISSYPSGWSFSNFDARNGRARFLLNNDRAGFDSVKVTLTERCSLAGATEIPSDELGTRRYERIDRVKGGLAGARIYTFTGGCAVYDIKLPANGSALVNEISVALGFKERTDVAKEVLRLSKGDEKL